MPMTIGIIVAWLIIGALFAGFTEQIIGDDRPNVASIALITLLGPLFGVGLVGAIIADKHT